MNVFSNRHASSKDITEKFANHQLMKFVVSGGFWGPDYRYRKKHINCLNHPDNDGLIHCSNLLKYIDNLIPYYILHSF